jgi:hypothetical protein
VCVSCLVLFQRTCNHGGVFDWYPFSLDEHVRGGAYRRGAVRRTFIATVALRAFLRGYDVIFDIG